MATNQNTKRKDKARVVLRKGESQRKDGKYDFRWTSPDGKRHSIYAATLEEFREKENDIQRDSLEGIKAEARYVTLNDMFTLWAKVKRGLKDNHILQLMMLILLEKILCLLNRQLKILILIRRICSN